MNINFYFPSALQKYTQCDHALGNAYHSVFMKWVDAKWLSPEKDFLSEGDYDWALGWLYHCFSQLVKKYPDLEISCLRVDFNIEKHIVFLRFTAKTKDPIEDWEMES